MNPRDMMMARRFGITPGASNAKNVTPSDSVALTTPARRLWIGGGANPNATKADLSVTLEGGDTVTFKNLPVGYMLEQVVVIKVNATGTTATNIVALPL